MSDNPAHPTPPATEGIVLREINATTYRSDEGHTLKREDVIDPHGNLHRAVWVYRRPDGRELGFDRYRYDVASRHRFTLLHPE